MRDSVAGWLLWMGMVAGIQGQAAPAKIQFSLDRAGAGGAQYTLTVAESGEGLYLPHLTPAASLEIKATPETDAREIRASQAVVTKLFAAVPMVEGGRCETHNKNIAKTGVKIMRYSGAGREAQCTFNYSDDDRVNDAVTAFEGLAETLQMGDRLRAKLRFDRLGLDGELEGLQTAVTEGRALEVGNIAPVLKSIAEDERVMDRARRRAERLLQGVPPAQAVEGVASGATSSSPQSSRPR